MDTLIVAVRIVVIAALVRHFGHPFLELKLEVKLKLVNLSNWIISIVIVLFKVDPHYFINIELDRVICPCDCFDIVIYII